MKRFYPFLLLAVLLGFSAQAQAQKKGKKYYKKRYKTKTRLQHSFVYCFFEEPPQCELPKADEELDENRDYLFTQVDEPPIFEVCKDNINKRKCFQDQLEQHVKIYYIIQHYF